MKKLISIFVTFAAIIGAGIYFLLPNNINWEKYVHEAQAEIRSRTGLSLTIQGRPSFSLKPSAILKLGRISLGNVYEGTYPQMMTAARGEVLFDTASLFRRKIKVKKIILYSPQFHFETMPNGKWNWQIAFFDQAGRDASIGFESLVLSDGTAEVKSDKYTPAQKWDRINAELFADSIQGPFFFEGNFGALSSSFNFSLKVEKYLNGQSPDFSVRLINAPAEASFVFTGTYGMSDADRGVLTGGLTFDVRKPDQFFTLLYPQEKLPPSLFQTLVGNMKIKKSAQTRTTEWTDVLFKYGASAATGRMTIRSLTSQEASALQAKKDAEDLDDEDIVLHDPANPSVAVRLDNTPVSQTTVAQNVLPKVVDGSFVFSKLDADPFFDSLPALADFMARRDFFKKTQDSYKLQLVFDTANYKRDVIHQLSARIESIQNGLSFNDFSATLPSDAYITGNAELLLVKKPVFSGKLSVEANNLNAVLSWLEVPVPEETPQTLLRQFKVDTEFKAAANGIVLNQLKGKLDKMDFSGAFAWRGGRRKAISLSGTISDLNFADYFPVKSKEFVRKSKEFSSLPEKEKVTRLFQTMSFLNDSDMNVKLQSNSLAWGDFKTGEVKFDFSALRGQMRINEISVKKLLASTFLFQGGLEGFGGEPKFTGFKLNIDSRQLSSLMQTLGISLPKGMTSQDWMTLSARLTGTMLLMDFDAKVDFGSARFSGQGEFKENGTGVYDWNTTVDIYHDNFRNFVRFFSDAYRPLLANPGALQLKGQLFSNRDQFQLSGMQLQIGENALTGSVRIRLRNETPEFEAELTGEDLVLLGVLPQINLTDTVSVDTRKVIPENFWEKNGVLTEFANNLAFSKKPFDFSFLGKYKASIALKAKNLFFNSFVLSEVDSVLSLAEDKVSLDLRRSLWNGSNFGGIFSVMPAGDTTSFRSAFRISNINIPARLFDTDILDVSAVDSMILNLNVTGNGKTTDAMISSLTGKGSISFEKADLNHFNLTGFLKDIDRPQMSESTLLDNALSGSTVLNRFSGDVSIQNGMFTISPASFLYNGGRNTSPFFRYDYIGHRLSTSVSFPMNVQSVPPLNLSVKKIPDRPAELSQNVLEVVRLLKKMEIKQKEQLQEQKQEEERKEREENEKRARLQTERLNEMESRLTLASTEITQKKEKAKSIIEKLYQLHKYLAVFDKAENTLASLIKEVQKTKSLIEGGSDVPDQTIDTLEQKIENDYFGKENEINSVYNTIVFAESRGVVFDLMKQTEEILRTEIKNQTLYADLPDIEDTVEEIKHRLKKLQDLNTQAEQDGLDKEALMELAAQAEVEFDKVKSVHQKITSAVEEKEEQIVAEERAKREAEEARLKAEEEAKKAAEAAEEAKIAAEKARLEAEQRERQRTIVRKDGVQTSSPKKEASVSLRPAVMPEETQTNQNENRTGVEKKSPVVIRRH